MSHDITQKTREVRDHKNRDKATEAEERKQAVRVQSNAERIKILDARLGVGVGAAKERRRLMT